MKSLKVNTMYRYKDTIMKVNTFFVKDRKDTRNVCVLLSRALFPASIGAVFA